MSTKKKKSKSTALVPVEKRAVAALGLQHREKELVALAATTAHIVTITNDDGYKQVDSARKALKRTRLEIQNVGDETIEEAKRVVKLADAELTRLVGIVEIEEDRLKALQDARDTEIEAQRQADIDREIARQEALQERIAELRGNQLLTPTSGAALIAEHISDLEAISVDDSFEELHEQAEAAKAAGLSRLREIHAAAVAHEAEQKRIADERVELERLRREAAERAAAQAEEDRKAKVARDAEAARHAEQLRQQAEDAAKEQAARQKIIDDNNARIAAEQKAAQQKIDAERAEVAREQEELRKTQEPGPPPNSPVPFESIWEAAPVSFGEGTIRDAEGAPLGATAEITLAVGTASLPETRFNVPHADVVAPCLDELIEAVAEEFGVDLTTALGWLAQHDWRAALAEAA